MRDMKQIKKEITETQDIFDQLVFEIGKLYIQNILLINTQEVVNKINNKVDTFRKVELLLKILNEELEKLETKS